MGTETNNLARKQPRAGAASEPPPSRYSDRIENYSPERLAEFLLNNAATPEEYAAAVQEVRKMGIDPTTIPHEKPTGA
jgi:hypothetical protein